MNYALVVPQKTPAPKPTLVEGLASLEQHGISMRSDTTLDDILYSTGGSLEDHTDYISLICTLGAESERRDGHFLSDDIWHFVSTKMVTT